MASVQYVNATCTYDSSCPPAIDALNLDIEDGEFVVLVGPSGSGKSTALRMLAGLEPVTNGALMIDGVDIADCPPKDRDIAMVFQNYALYPNMTVAENMGFALQMRGVDKRTRREKIAEAATLLDLTAYLDRKPAKLSGGQRQRVAMGRAIVRSPKVFCMDEPLSNLDAKLRVQTRTQIAALQRRLETTTVYVTHDQVEAMTLGHRVAVIKDGRLQQFSRPKDLYDRPVNSFVAGFIGSPAINLLTVPIRDDGSISLCATPVPLTRAHLAAARSADLSELRVGIRPEHLQLCPPKNGATGRIELIEDLGSEAFAYVQPQAAAGDPIAIRMPGRLNINVGELVDIELRSPDDVHIFNPHTGERLIPDDV
jgi:multiple sugar transport system ATP-binding protein